MHKHNRQAPAVRILVTGATGFIGRALVPRLQDEGRLLTLAVRNKAAVPCSWMAHPTTRVVEIGDIETAANLDDTFADVTSVAHLAGLTDAQTSAGTDLEAQFHNANVVATRKLAEAALGRHVRTFIHLSSVLAVSDNISATTIDDAAEPAPNSAYGKSKQRAEACLKVLSENNIFAISLRLPLVVGPDAKGNWAALQTLAATGVPLPFGSIRNRRSMIGVDSAVDAIVHLCSGEWPAEHSGAYCIADADPVSTGEIVTALREGLGIAPRVVPFPPALLSAFATLINQRRRAASLLGNSEVDDERFRETFGYRIGSATIEAIRRSASARSLRAEDRPAEDQPSRSRKAGRA